MMGEKYWRMEGARWRRDSIGSIWRGGGEGGD